MSATEQRDDAGVKINREFLLEQYPQLRTIPVEHAEVILLTLVGFQPKDIVEHLEITISSVYYVLRKYDVVKMLRQQVDIQRMFLANELGTIQVHAIAALKTKIPKLKDLSPQALVKFIGDCSTVITSMRVKRIEQASTEQELLKDLV